MALIIDGKKVSDEIKESLKQKAKDLLATNGVIPGLNLLLVGDDPASKIYVASKEKACLNIGFKSTITRLSSDSTIEQVLDIINTWNNDDKVHGILVQSPLPYHLDENQVINFIYPNKDVDGFHPVNVGKTLIGDDEGFAPCTPAGVIELLNYYNIETKGKHAVIVGRSNIVGKPMASLLLQKKMGGNAIVTLCHSAAKDISIFTKQADILISAVGKHGLISADMVKENCTIIDVGINRIDAPDTEKGYKVVGDVLYDELLSKVHAITPVPGGVGPMTIAMLLKNTYLAALKINNLTIN